MRRPQFNHHFTKPFINFCRSRVNAVAYQDLFKIRWQPLLCSYVTKTCVADSKPPRACYSAMFWSVCTCRACPPYIATIGREQNIYDAFMNNEIRLAFTIKTNRSKPEHCKTYMRLLALQQGCDLHLHITWYGRRCWGGGKSRKSPFGP